MSNIQEKLQKIVDSEAEYAERTGSSQLSTCDHSNWDRDVWNHRHEIISALRSRGFSVTESVRHGVTDIVITKKMNLN
jgi:hypothetical protein